MGRALSKFFTSPCSSSIATEPPTPLSIRVITFNIGRQDSESRQLRVNLIETQHVFESKSQSVYADYIIHAL